MSELGTGGYEPTESEVNPTNQEDTGTTNPETENFWIEFEASLDQFLCDVPEYLDSGEISESITFLQILDQISPTLENGLATLSPDNKVRIIEILISRQRDLNRDSEETGTKLKIEVVYNNQKVATLSKRTMNLNVAEITDFRFSLDLTAEAKRLEYLQKIRAEIARQLSEEGERHVITETVSLGKCRGCAWCRPDKNNNPNRIDFSDKTATVTHRDPFDPTDRNDRTGTMVISGVPEFEGKNLISCFDELEGTWGTKAECDFCESKMGMKTTYPIFGKTSKKKQY